MASERSQHFNPPVPTDALFGILASAMGSEAFVIQGSVYTCSKALPFPYQYISRVTNRSLPLRTVRLLVFVNNSYHLPDRRGAYFTWENVLNTVRALRAFGQDRGSRF